MYKVFVSTVPFAEKTSFPLDLLLEHGCEVEINPLGRKIRGDELIDFIKDADILIAGTEEINSATLKKAKNLKLICRVGIGLDGLDLNAARELGIAVTYTPDAPAPAVAELTIGLMLNGLRRISAADRNIRSGLWERHFGKRISETKIGLIGCGRIGGRVIRKLRAFGTPIIFANDLSINDKIDPETKINWVSKEEIYAECDVISFHLPLTKKTLGLVGKKQFEMMREDVLLINTARGGILNETELSNFLRKNAKAHACVDVFVTEPYKGELSNLKNITLTCHMGSMTVDCRSRMELEACEEVINLIRQQPYRNPVPNFEYELSGEKYE